MFFSSDVRLNPNGPLYLLPTEAHPEGLYAGTNILLPTSKEEMIWIIKSVAATHEKDGGSGRGHGRRIKVVGSGHSWSKVAKSDDIQISLENYKVHASLNRTHTCTISQLVSRGSRSLQNLVAISHRYR